MEDLSSHNKIAACGRTGCPTIYEAEEDSLLVQGYTVDAGPGLPVGESVVRIPLTLLRDAARALEK